MVITRGGDFTSTFAPDGSSLQSLALFSRTGAVAGTGITEEDVGSIVANKP